MSERQCDNCGGKGWIDNQRCPKCQGSGLIRPVFMCPVCGGGYSVPRDPPVRVRCPHCGSLLWTYWQTVQVDERGVVPIPTPGSRVPLGTIGGGLLGLAIGGPAGALIGGLLGLAAGVAAERVLEALEE